MQPQPDNRQQQTGPVYNPFNLLNGSYQGRPSDRNGFINRPKPDEQVPLPPPLPLIIGDDQKIQVDNDQRGHHFLAYMEKVRKIALDAGVKQGSGNYFNPMRSLQ